MLASGRVPEDAVLPLRALIHLTPTGRQPGTTELSFPSSLPVSPPDVSADRGRHVRAGQEVVRLTGLLTRPGETRRDGARHERRSRDRLQVSGDVQGQRKRGEQVSYCS